MRRLYLLPLVFSLTAESQEYLDPFDERRVKIHKEPFKKTYNDAHKICKDRWFEPQSIIKCRAKDYLEQFALSDFKYVGYLTNENGVSAILTTDSGETVRMSTGSHIGKGAGEVKAITEDYIVIFEIATSTDPNDETRFFSHCNYILREGVAEDKHHLPEFP